MKEKILTNEGIKEVDEVVDIETPPRQTFTRQEKKTSMKEFNDRPIVKNNKIVALNKTFLYIYIIATTFLIIGLLATHVFWYNSSFNKKDFAPVIDNNVQPSDVVVNDQETHNHNIHINNTVILPDDLTIKLINETG